MIRRGIGWSWIAPTVSALALALLSFVFFRELGSFRAALTEWAERDLASRADMAAGSLREALETSDLPRLHAFSERCEEKGLRLTVRSPRGGVFFDSRRDGAGNDGPFLFAERPCGDFTVRLGLPCERVYEPLRRARFGFLLAALVGASAIGLVFFAFYRQRVRIAELTRLERFRRAFVADVSHEIKTPLTGILGAVDMLKDTPADDATTRAVLLDMVRRESARLNGLVQQILDLARLEREGVALDLAEADLGDLVRESVMRFSAEAAERHVRLVADGLPASGSVVACCDARRLQQALDNLIENALRYSQSPEVAVSLSIRGGEQKPSCRRSRPNRAVLLSVEDHGVGIAPADAAHVFERFYPADPSRAAETGGTGLGLAIVRQIARLHGGDVTLESVAPHGCRFTLCLRVRRFG